MHQDGPFLYASFLIHTLETSCRNSAVGSLREWGKFLWRGGIYLQFKSWASLSLWFNVSSNVESLYLQTGGTSPASHHSSALLSLSVSMCERTGGLIYVTAPSSVTLPTYLSVGLWISQEISGELPVSNNPVYISFSEVVRCIQKSLFCGYYNAPFSRVSVCF